MEIGVRRRRVDGDAKVRGATRYAADLPVHGLLHARPVLSPEAHARISGIDVAEARTMPGVVDVLTAGDLPIVDGASGRPGEPLAREEAVFAGQPVALVIAESEAAAADAVEAVVVDYEPLPAAVDLEAAMAPGAALARLSGGGDEGGAAAAAHATAGGGGDGGDGEELSDNVAGRRRLRAGEDAEALLAASAAVASATFRTPWMYQAYMEPQTATAWLEPEGDLVVSTSTQGAFATRKLLAGLLGLPMHRVRVRPAPLGGGFGGKMFVVEPLAAAAALKLGRPVRLELTRMEDVAATNPAPAQIIELAAGADADGNLTAVRGRVMVDVGGINEFGNEALGALLASGPYRWAARDITGYAVLTNRVTAGAYRAPTAPPAAFAIESLLDELAAELGIDPIELRLRNVLREGDPGPDGQPVPVFGAAECLERLRDHPLRTRELGPDEGVGVAIGWWPGGLEPAAASCRLDGDGVLTIVTGAVDMSGTETGFATIASAAFGIPPERVRVIAADTAGAPAAGITGGSKITYTVGRAVERAAEEARERLLDVAARELEIAPEDLEIADGSVRAAGSPASAIAIADLAAKALDFGSPHAPIEGHSGIAQESRAPLVAAQLAHVRVDRETGAVEVLRHVIVQDVGRALNPALVEDQLLGGVTQGLGWALFEELAHDDAGQLRTGSLVEYAIPSAEAVPPIEMEIVEVPAPDGPFGARGIGEGPVIATAAAVAAAIAAATGVRLRELPMSPLRVWTALSDVDRAGPRPPD